MAESELRFVDLGSWQSILLSVLTLALIAFVSVGIRVLMMVTIQKRRERMNRQINERLRTLIAAYKVLGGSFTGNLAVDPSHMRDIRQRSKAAADAQADEAETAEAEGGTDRRRRIRDAAEAALSDILLLGTEEHVRLAERAAHELVAGRPVHTQDLVVSLRAFIRKALDLDPIPDDVDIPMQGPTRPSSSGGRERSGERGRGGGQGGGGQGGDGGGMGMGVGMGAGMGAGGLGAADEASAGR